MKNCFLRSKFIFYYFSKLKKKKILIINAFFQKILPLDVLIKNINF